jgi:hypothetical protein
MNTNLDNPKAPNVIDYLTTLAKVMRECQPASIIVSPPAFVLQYGEVFDTGIPVLKPVKHGIIKECYINAMKLARRGTRYTYVEGYALSIIPVPHAWCIDNENGAIVDNTWRRPGREYVGVKFKSEYVHANMPSYIDNWENDWPLLRMNTEDLQQIILQRTG